MNIKKAHRALNHIYTDLAMILDGTLEGLDMDNTQATFDMLDDVAIALDIELEDVRPEEDRP